MYQAQAGCRQRRPVELDAHDVLLSARCGDLDFEQLSN
jgi:hypothetical protein